jgi:hypothetical protein
VCKGALCGFQALNWWLVLFDCVGCVESLPFVDDVFWYTKHVHYTLVRI